VGLPVFTSRTFRHDGVIVRKEIGDLHELEGARVAVPEYHMTAALFMRGLLADDLKFDHRSVTWVQAGQYAPGRVEREKLALPPDVRVERVADRTIDEMLAANNVQAALTPYRSTLFDRGDCPIRTYFGDPMAAAEDWYRRTKVFPIMHLVVVRRSIVERHPWVAANLVRAFTVAKDLCLERMEGIGGHPPVALPFFLDQIARARTLLGNDLWPYGVAANRTTLEFACRYAHEQGLSERLVNVEELFAPDVVAPAYVD
jgi:4,5-dihydroxyphthalate decarboxylase